MLWPRSTFAQADSARTEKEKHVHFWIRFGASGFSDERSEIGGLGGAYLGLHVKHGKLPLAISISTEYYTNSSSPTNPYEIDQMALFKFMYSEYFFKCQRLNFYAGAGTGWLKIPDGITDSPRVMPINFEAGMQARLLWKFGLFASYQYLYAKKGQYIDFSEHIWLIGINFTFGV
jgi:hypothetical protein